jgi:DNA polymerase-1
MSDRLFLIDGHATLYRAYFAIKTRMAAPGTGVPTHAAFGFTKILRSLLEREKPEYLAVTLDSPGPTFRHQQYKEYKSSRPGMPDDLKPQIEMVERICDAYGIPVYRLAGYEADDILGTLAAQAVGREVEVVIVSGDKDVLQLVSDPQVSVFDPTKGEGSRTGSGKLYRERDVEEARGVHPRLLLDVFGLAGDTSDDIPGVPGIGPKTAVALIKKYGTLEDVLAAAAAGKEKGKRGEKLTAFADQARLSRTLATICREAPVQLDLEKCRLGEGDSAKLISVFQELNFRAFLSTVAPSAKTDGGMRYVTVDTPDALDAFVKELSAQPCFAVDLETDSVRPRSARLVGLSFSWKAKQAYYIPVRGPALERTLDEATVLAALKPTLENEALGKIGQNAKYDTIVLRNAGVELRGLVFDTMVASYLLDPGTRAHNLDALALQHLGYRKIATEEVIGKGKTQTTMDAVPVERVAKYSCEDADITWRLYELLAERLREQNLEDLYRKLEHPLIDVLVELEFNGIAVDSAALGALSQELAETLAIEEKAIHEAAGREFNVNSPKQLKELLYDELKLPVLKKTKTGPSTDSDVLQRLADRHPLPKLVLRYRELAKLKSTYADTLPEYVDPRTGRIHASFHQTVTATGRLSSSEPNLQNIPVRSEQGRAIRQCFVSGERGWKLLGADYSQIELRLLAHLSGDPRLVDAFVKGLDIHAAVAAELDGIAVDQVSQEQRRRAKTVNFGLMYGQGAQHLADTTGMTVEEAEAFIERYFTRFAGIKAFKEDVLARARADGFVHTMMDRVRYLSEINSDDIGARRAAERMAFNTVIQGSAADLIKRAMIDIHRRMRSQGMSSRMLLQVHDELVFEAPERELDALRGLVETHMTRAAVLKVPLVVDSLVGDNWLDME